MRGDKILQLSFTTDIQTPVTVRASAITPTQRSLVARQRSKSLDDGWREDSLRRAIRVTAFPRNAVTDRKEFKTERNVKWLCSRPDKLGEQDKSTSVFCCPSPVTFGAAIPNCKIVIRSFTVINSETFQRIKETAKLTCYHSNWEAIQTPFFFMSPNLSAYRSLTVWKHNLTSQVPG